MDFHPTAVIHAPRAPEKECTEFEGLRVAQFVGRFGGWGAERLMFHIALGLQGRGAYCACVQSASAAESSVSFDKRAEIVSLEVRRQAKSAPAQAAWRLSRFLVEQRVDLIHCHGSGWSLPLCTMAAFLTGRRPKVWYTWHTPNEVPQETGAQLRLKKWSLRRCDRILCASHAIAEKVKCFAGVAHKTEVFANAVDESEPSSGLRDAVPQIVWAARVTEYKDPLALIEAAKVLRSEGLRFRLQILGGALPADVSYDQRCRLAISDQGLSDCVQMVGWIDDVRPHLSGAAIGVQTSRAEGLSISLLEQMMAGLAIVATDVGDTSRAVQHGDSGLIVPPGDSMALVQALRYLITHVEQRVRLGQRARERALADFSTSVMVRRIGREYLESIRSDRGVQRR